MSSYLPKFGFELLVFVAVLAALEGLFLLVSGSRRARQRTAVVRLRRHAAALSERALADGASIVRRTETGGPLARAAARLARRASLELLLYRAGLTWSVGRFCALSGALAGAVLALGLWLGPLPWAVCAALGVGLLPLVFVTGMARRRMRRFEEQLPDALDLLCRALRAGISLDYGFKSAGEELADPAGTEFGQVAHEVSLGLPLRTALDHLGERVISRDLPFFATAVLIQRETGGNLAEILDNLAGVVRERLQFQLKLRSLLAQMKLTANVLALLPFVFAGLISIASPGYLDPLFQTQIGQKFLYAAVALAIAGWVLCRRMGVVRL
jgi:tight adherence protein B